MYNKLGCLLLFCLVLLSCKEENTMPKPKALLRLEYPTPKEAQFETDDFSL